MSPAWVARPLPAATMVAVAPTLVARSQVSFSVRAMLARVAIRCWEFPCGVGPQRRRWLAIRVSGEVPRRSRRPDRSDNEQATARPQSSTSLNASVNFHSLFRGRGRVRYRLMSAPSPVPASGVASDGKWSPPRWETTFISVTNESLQVVIDEANRHTNTHGAEGWEVVNSSVQRVQVSHHFAGYDKGGEFYFEWSIVCTMKRPLPPA